MHPIQSRTPSCVCCKITTKPVHVNRRHTLPRTNRRNNARAKDETKTRAHKPRISSIRNLPYVCVLCTFVSTVARHNNHQYHQNHVGRYGSVSPRSVSVENGPPFNHHHHQQNYCYYYYYNYYHHHLTVLCYTASTITITRT